LHSHKDKLELRVSQLVSVRFTQFSILASDRKRDITRVQGFKKKLRYARF
jgi:uncharacterized protein YjaG (DUF416 family)